MFERGLMGGVGNGFLGTGFGSHCPGEYVEQHQFSRF